MGTDAVAKDTARPARRCLLGNEAIGRGLVEQGCHLVMAYPGTPSSEVLPAVVRFAQEENVALHAEWCSNEKVALEQALAASYTGKRTAVVMKQVGLNVAADPLMSAAYIGVLGGMVIVVADDPGPTASQTEQDTRQFAHFAKIPVLDPCSPDEARRMVAYGFDLSERHETPVILRVALRVCHGREDVPIGEVKILERRARFKRDPTRWAATPRHRYRQHLALNQRLEAIAGEFAAERRFNWATAAEARTDFAIVAAGNPYGVLMDLLAEHGLEGRIPVLKVGTPFPFPTRLVDDFVERYDEVLVLEETDEVLELLIEDRRRLRGRRDGTVPGAGELDGAVIGRVLGECLQRHGIVEQAWETGGGAVSVVESLDLPQRKPVLCPACPHRASFLAIRRAGGNKGIYPSDIGCYTLGLNQGAVDTVHDMGAAVSMASGFYRAFAHDAPGGDPEGRTIPPIIATIGDSTFYHGGMAPLASAVYSRARFTLVILDNLVTAMTGMQPTLAYGKQADGMLGQALPLEQTCRGLGIEWVEVVDPFDVPGMEAVLKRAIAHNRDPEGGLAVVIARRPCALNEPTSFVQHEVQVNSRCDLCGLCLKRFGCPALVAGEEKVEIDRSICVDCGVCVHACAKGAIVQFGGGTAGSGGAFADDGEPCP
ncbi:MAG TPA: indolepyruvate ferredoxin oxidoreductase subunit alpha [Acidobacteria bacterium]|nr:indolepyruvate ferredoxin oxidoreductase subunit alpha [Acidobacteriota bacterium]